MTTASKSGARKSASKSAKKSAKKTAKKTAIKTASKSAKKTAEKTAVEADHCWPGYEPVAGKMSNEKGSCKKKAKPTASEKRADSKAAAARKREKD